MLVSRVVTMIEEFKLACAIKGEYDGNKLKTMNVEKSNPRPGKGGKQGRGSVGGACGGESLGGSLGAEHNGERAAQCHRSQRRRQGPVALQRPRIGLELRRPATALFTRNVRPLAGRRAGRLCHQGAANGNCADFVWGPEAETPIRRRTTSTSTNPRGTSRILDLSNAHIMLGWGRVATHTS